MTGWEPSNDRSDPRWTLQAAPKLDRPTLDDFVARFRLHLVVVVLAAMSVLAALALVVTR